MTAMGDWIDIKIRDMFASSMPGDWGTEGNPEEGVPVLRSTNFRNNGSIDYSDIAYRKVEEGQLNKRRIERGTILIEKSGGSPSQAAGRVVYCDRDFNGTASNFIEVVKVKDDFSSRYVAFLLYYLYQSGLVLKYQQQTTGIINFKLNEYSEETVKCPTSKAEQAKIAEILSTVDRAIEQTEALIAKQQRIKTGMMQDILTRGVDEQGNLRSEQTHKFKDSPLGRIPVEWAVVETTKVCDLITKGTTPKVTSTESSRYSIPYLRVQNLTFSGQINFSEERIFIDSATQDGELARSKVYPGDVLQNIVGPPLGKVGIVPSDYREWNINQAIAIFRPNAHMLNIFLCHWLLTPFALTWFDINSKKTTGQQNLTLELCQNLPIVLPPLEEQHRICLSIERSVKSQGSGENALQKLCSLKTGLMQILLTGKKRVTTVLKAAVEPGNISADSSRRLSR